MKSDESLRKVVCKMDKNEVAFWLIVFLFAFMFCGKPDLHDKLLEKVNAEVVECK